MDFLDPQKQRSHAIRLFVGYFLIGVGIVIATIVLLYQAYGFGLDRKGEIIQNGLVFVSSQPRGAQIYLNTKGEQDTTNTKLQIPGGEYKLELQREGYHSWERQIKLEGGSVEHFDYPLLFPATLQTNPVKTYESMPGLATASPDRRWLVVQQPGSALNFDVYDVGNPKQVAARTVQISLPASIISAPRTAGHSYTMVEWSNNNRHVVLQHTFAGGTEYILLNRTDPEESVNLTQTLNLQAGDVLSLRDKKFDRYYIFNPAAKTLMSTTLDPEADRVPLIDNLLAYKSYGSDKVLYATETGAAEGKVLTMLLDGDTTYKIREHPAGAPYLVDIARYDGDWIVAVGSSADNKVYVYKNPQAVRKAGKQAVLVPVRVLKVPAPNYMSFSSNTQLLMVENGNAFATYDLETDRSYTYTTTEPIDPPATHATCMDGHRIVYVSGGKLVVFDYDNINRRTLVNMTPTALPFFDRDYRYLYALQPAGATPRATLTSTSMLVPEDQ